MKEEIRKRFAPDVIRRLQALRWWDWPEERIQRAIHAIRAGEIELLEKP